MLAVDEEEEEDEEKEAMEAKRRKPWGDSYHFCPVALFESNVLWPGQAEHVIRYKDKLYFFSSEEAKNKFLASPLTFVGDHKPLKVRERRVNIDLHVYMYKCSIIASMDKCHTYTVHVHAVNILLIHCVHVHVYVLCVIFFLHSRLSLGFSC